MEKVIKRNGKEEMFNKQKITNAILAAFSDVDKEINDFAKQKAWEITNYISKIEETTSVEDIQNIVEDKLMACNRKDVARSYIRYRYKREMLRDTESDLMKEVAEKVMASNVQNQNANVDEHSFGGRMGEARNSIMKKYALDFLISEKARNNHLNNEIYIHDLDSYAVGEHNCLTIPFDDLLRNGFNTRQSDVRPANSVSTAFQLVAVIFQLQSLQQFGGVSASHLDWTMVPYVRKSFYKHFKEIFPYFYPDETFKDVDKPEDISIEDNDYKYYAKGYKYASEMTLKEVQQAAEGMYHNLNTLQSRSGNQLPFTSINYGTCTLPEGRIIIKALLEGSIKGVGKVHKTPIFPCGIFQCMKGVNRQPGDPNYDMFKLALQSTAKRLYPNYANVDWSVNEGYDRNDPRTYVATMGCRTYNGKDINADPGVNPQIKDGRGNICPVTIILPTLAMEARNKAIEAGFGKTNDDCLDPISAFIEILNTKIDEAMEMLLERYKHIISQDPRSASFMYENNIMLGYDGKTIESAMKHGTLVIGQLGLAETLQILIGKNHTTPAGMSLAKRIEQLFKDRCAEFKQKLHLNVGVYYTPAENLCYTAMKKFKDKYGVIENVSDRDYFTNSMHVPVWEKISPFDKIDIEAELTGYSNAGCITYIELDSGAKNNLEALETIVNYAMDKDIPYFAINVPNDTCLDCGYCDEFNDHCPMCGSHNIQQLRRVTGYLTGDYKSAFNYGKQKEVEDRYKHSKKLEEWRTDEIL